MDHDFGTAAFDLVHSRATLAYVPERDRILGAAIAALRAGGWCCIEEPVLVPALIAESTDLSDASARVLGAVQTLLQAAGTDLRYGLRVPNVLADLGVDVVSSEGNREPAAHVPAVPGTVCWPGEECRGDVLRANDVMSSKPSADSTTPCHGLIVDRRHWNCGSPCDDASVG